MEDKAKKIAELKEWAQRRGWKLISGSSVFQRWNKRTLQELQMEFTANQLKIYEWCWRSRKSAEKSGKPFGPYKRLVKWGVYHRLTLSRKDKLRGLENEE